jgi:hypothetical protein
MNNIIILMVAKYNQLDLIRHNLYKKRSARINKAAYKLREAYHIAAKLLNHDIRRARIGWDLEAQKLVWSKKDEQDLLKARANLKKYGKQMSKVLRENKLKAVRLPGRNKIVKLIPKK